MTKSCTLGVARTDLARTTLVVHELPELADGEALLKVDRVGLTGYTEHWDRGQLALSGNDYRGDDLV